jgi:hypothetical protein
LTPLRPARIVPSHGAMGDATLIESVRGYLTDVQTRAAHLKGQGKSSEETVQLLTAEIPPEYPGWTAPNSISAAARIAWTEAK